MLVQAFSDDFLTAKVAIIVIAIVLAAAFIPIAGTAVFVIVVIKIGGREIFF